MAHFSSLALFCSLICEESGPVAVRGLVVFHRRWWKITPRWMMLSSILPSGRSVLTDERDVCGGVERRDVYVDAVEPRLRVVLLVLVIIDSAR
jgi:hypothetical protein